MKVTGSKSAGLTALGQIAVTVEDIERARAFYAETLELPFLFQAGSMAFFDLEGVRLMLTEPESGDEPHSASVLYFRAPDLESRVESLEEKGVDFVGQPHVVHRTEEAEIWMAFFRDPDGHLMALMNERQLG
jgi:catechol 2,3-dioxygenase-like lactoylglutathione lyase family enzyme